MNVSRPHAIISRGVDGDVLRTLSATTEPMTGRQVHRIIGHGSNRTVQLALDRFSAEGLLHVSEQGSAKLYTFNHDHLAAEPVLALMQLRATLLDRLREEFSSWRPAAAHASMFGSTARGDGDTASDIDLLVVRPNDVDAEDEAWRAQVERLSDNVLRWTGNRAGISEMSEREVLDMLADEPPILAELRADAIALEGLRFGSYIRRLA